MATLERFGSAGHDLVVLDEVRGRLSIGKSPDNDLAILDDPAVSRVHALLEHVGPAWCITDVGSTNGTSVNGERLFAPRTLADRDEILVGRTRLVLRDAAARGDVTTEPTACRARRARAASSGCSSSCADPCCPDRPSRRPRPSARWPRRCS